MSDHEFTDPGATGGAAEPASGHVDAVELIVYLDDGEWYWVARDTNHEIVADSGDDGYKRKSWAVKAARDLFGVDPVVKPFYRP